MYENDCMPGDELFTSDLINYCFETGMFDESDEPDEEGKELIRRFMEVDIGTLHAIEYTQDIAGETGIICIGELPEYGIRLYGYSDETYWHRGVAVEIGDTIRFRVTPGYLTDAVSPQYDNMPALEFEVEVIESEKGLTFSVGELYR